MRKKICAPGSYIQGPGELKELATQVKGLSKDNAYMIVDAFIEKTYHDEIVSSFETKDMAYQLQVFGGECSMSEIKRHQEVAKDQAVIIGIGGGKTLDCAKAVAYYLEKPVIIVPTAASTDAPCSRLSVIYKDNGEFDRYLPLPSNPDVVLMDSEVIVKAPVKFLAAGIGDALATYFEAEACRQSRAITLSGGVGTKSAYALAKLCNDTLLEKGKDAIQAVKDGVLNEALEEVIEANTYLSGIGFESGGLAAAHAIHNGMTVLEETHAFLHGEKVAFGTLTQLALENRDDKEIKYYIDFCKAVGLPTTLEDLGLKDATDEYLFEAAKEACKEDDTMGNMPFAVSPEDIVKAMRKADALARQ